MTTSEGSMRGLSEKAADPPMTAPEGTDPTPGEVGLTPGEKALLNECASVGNPEHTLIRSEVYDAVERILAARTADLRAEAVELRAQMAKAWDEGWAAYHAYYEANTSDDRENPYRRD